MKSYTSLLISALLMASPLLSETPGIQVASAQAIISETPLSTPFDDDLQDPTSDTPALLTEEEEIELEESMRQSSNKITTKDLADVLKDVQDAADGKPSSKNGLTLDDEDQKLKKREIELVLKQLDINSGWYDIHHPDPSGFETQDFDLMLQDMIQDQIDQYEDWDDFARVRNATIKHWKKLQLQQKLSGIVDAFKFGNGSKQLWGDHLPAEMKNYGKISIRFDTVNEIVTVYTDAVDAKGKPLLTWVMDVQ